MLRQLSVGPERCSMPHSKKEKKKKQSTEILRTKFADFCSPSNAVFNPLHLTLWCVLDQATNKTSHHNLEPLKAAIKTEWANMSDRFVVDSCKFSDIVLKL